MEVMLRRITLERNQLKTKAETMARDFIKNISELRLDLEFLKQDQQAELQHTRCYFEDRLNDLAKVHNKNDKSHPDTTDCMLSDR